MTRIKTAALLTSALLLAACGGAETVTEDATPAPAVQEEARLTLADTIAHPRRAKDQPRDQFRNPAGTLEFFEVGPGQTVAEIWPGWYTDIIAPYLADNDGQYVAVLYPTGINERLDARVQGFKDKYADTDTYGEIQYGSFIGNQDGATLSLPDNSVDTLLTFRNVHNWMGGGYEDEAYAEFFRVLKPGGTFGLVEHRLPETRTQDPKGSTGYVQESYMKKKAMDAGFEFVASSEVNANPLDTADHPFGVWTLQPRSRTPEAGSEEAKDFDAALYRNIGESDRATLKFRKPG